MRTPLAGYLVALIGTIIAAAIVLALDAWLAPSHLLFFSLVLVLIVSWTWGVGPGLFALLLGAGAVLLQPGGAPGVQSATELINLGGFLIAGGLAAVILADRRRRLVEHARLLDQVRASEARYRGLFEGIDDAIIVADASGRFIDVNPAASALLGYTREELLRMQVGDLGAGDPAPHRERFAALQRAGRWHGEVDLRRADGTVVPTESWQRVVELPGDTVYVSVWRDISERRALEQLQREVLAMVTHDLKTPLTSIKAMAQLMQRRGVYREQSVTNIVAQAERLERLVNDLLDVSRLETGRLELQRETVDLVAVVRETVEAARALSPAHRISVEAPDRPLMGEFDYHRLAQILQNLLSNAVRYSPAGSTIRVSVTDLGDAAQIAVSDQGPGIPPEALARIFERFYRAEAAAVSQPQGLGLGLYIARGLVEAHGGRVWAESTAGQGSTFYVRLPYGRPAAPAPDGGQTARSA